MVSRAMREEAAVNDKIEILSVELLTKHRERVAELTRLSERLPIQLGWHYLLDLAWMLENLGNPRGLVILDAGAGLGVMQWHLLEQKAAKVISVDRVDRSELRLGIRARYRVTGMRPADLKSGAAIVRKNVAAAAGAGKISAALRGLGGLFLSALPKAFPGKLVFYHHDLAFMPDIPDNSLDAAVAVSALEHNASEELPGVVSEIMRKLKPGGRLLATLGAAKEKDWFHEPSRGWNYTDATLRRLFSLAPGAPSNYDRFDALFASLKDCAELRDNLAPFYSKSGDNGMPWGKWDPQYQPVGVCKTKPA
ncbi:MAG: type 11 methyltransferase [Anaerolineaceae bacterium]|nr:MAG: type 11 methyltransferase [Anaerolineaceae bacterium]